MTGRWPFICVLCCLGWVPSVAGAQARSPHTSAEESKSNEPSAARSPAYDDGRFALGLGISTQWPEETLRLSDNRVNIRYLLRLGFTYLLQAGPEFGFGMASEFESRANRSSFAGNVSSRLRSGSLSAQVWLGLTAGHRKHPSASGWYRFARIIELRPLELEGGYRFTRVQYEEQGDSPVDTLKENAPFGSIGGGIRIRPIGVVLSGGLMSSKQYGRLDWGPFFRAVISIRLGRPSCRDLD